MNKVNHYAAHLFLAQERWARFLRPGDGAVDATCGNGRDLLFLCQLGLSHPKSYVAGFDVQAIALQRTKDLLNETLSEEQKQRVLLFHQSHTEMYQTLFPFPPRLFVYNLGYLPRGDHTLTTRTETTLLSLERALPLLETGGAISMMCYSGHPEGAREEAALLLWAAQLDPKKWEVCHHRWLNRPQSPSFLWIEHRP